MVNMSTRSDNRTEAAGMTIFRGPDEPTTFLLSSCGSKQAEDERTRDVGDTSDCSSAKKEANAKVDLLYSIFEIPPWYMCIILGLQHYLTAFGGTLSTTLLILPAFCVPLDDVAVPEILCTLLFVGGIVTVLQCTFGTRLPILQGGTVSFLIPTFAILSLPQYACPTFPDLSNTTLYNDSAREALADLRTETWRIRMREIQGAIILSSLFQVVIGACGLMGILLNYIGPLAITPTIALVGLSLFTPAADFCSGHWWIAIGTMLGIALFSQFLKNCAVPCHKATRQLPSGARSCVKAYSAPVFSLFPILLSMSIMWLICYILTVTDTLPNDPDKWGYLARTDTKLIVLEQAKWFRFPYPFQWGVPTFSVAGVFGMLAGVIAGMVESVGDYYACARLSGAPPPPLHAINRGILVEGIGCVMAGLWGTSTGTTSYSENIGTVGITRVGSRVVIQTAGCIMIVLGMLSKFAAFFVTIPQPIIGGVFMVTFGMIGAVGLSNLQYANMNSSRNLFIVGFSLFFGLALPQWIQKHPGAISTGSVIGNHILYVLLSTSMFVGGAIGFILDNAIPGSDEDRGINIWRRQNTGNAASLECYDLPWCMNCLSKAKCFKFIPFCPQMKFSRSCKCRRNEEVCEENGVVRKGDNNSRRVL